MKKKILIGSIIAVTLLLLMPSIPAIQQKSVEEGRYQELQEKLESINLNDLEGIEVLEWIRHPILYTIVMSILYFRVKRSEFLIDISSDIDIELPGGFPYDVHHPILFIRGFWLAGTAIGCLIFWHDISSKLGWNWGLPF